MNSSHNKIDTQNFYLNAMSNNNSNNNLLKPLPSFQQQPSIPSPTTLTSPTNSLYNNLDVFQTNNVISQPQHFQQPFNILQQQWPMQQQNFYPTLTQNTLGASALFPYNNNNLFDLKNQPQNWQSNSLDKRPYVVFSNNDTIKLQPSLPPPPTPPPIDGLKRSISLNNLKCVELKPPSRPAPKLPPTSQTADTETSDDLIDLQVSIDNSDDMSMFDPLFEPPSKNKEATAVPIINDAELVNIPKPVLTKPIVQKPSSLAPKPKSKSNNCSPESVVKTSIKLQLSNNDNKIENIEKFEFIEKNLSEIVMDIENFEVFINELKEQVNSESTINNNNKNTSASFTNSVIVYSQLLEQPILNDMDIKLIIRYYDTQTSKIKQISLNASINCTVETFLYELLSRFELSDLDINKYLLKIHGKEEYLPVKEILGELKYIQDCLCLNKDPIFVLIEVKNINRQLSMNVNKISESSKTFQYEIDKQIKFRYRLETLLANISRIKEEINKAVYNADQNYVLENWCRNYKSNINELIKLIHKINYTSLLDLTDRFQRIELDLKSYHSRFELNELSKKILTIANDLMLACIRFCNCASKSFDWPFKLSYNEMSEVVVEKRESIQSNENITIYVESLNNLLSFMSNLNLK